MSTFSIGQVARLLSVKTHTLRYWEEVAPLLRPQKNAGGRRSYSEANLRMLTRFRHLVVDLNFTVEGACHQLIREAMRKKPAFEICKQQLLTLLTRLHAAKSRTKGLLAERVPRIAPPPRVSTQVRIPPLRGGGAIYPKPAPRMSREQHRRDIQKGLCVLVCVLRSDDVEGDLSLLQDRVDEFLSFRADAAPFVMLVSPTHLSSVQQRLTQERFFGLQFPVLLPLYPLFTPDAHPVMSPVVEEGLALRSWISRYPRLQQLSVGAVGEALVQDSFYEAHLHSQKPISLLAEHLGSSLYRLRSCATIRRVFLARIEELLALGKWRLNFSEKMHEDVKNIARFECFRSDIAGYPDDVAVFVS